MESLKVEMCVAKIPDRTSAFDFNPKLVGMPQRFANQPFCSKASLITVRFEFAFGVTEVEL